MGASRCSAAGSGHALIPTPERDHIVTTLDLSALRRGLCPDGTLRAVINLGNPVLAQGTADAPAGITVDLAHAVADRLDVPVHLRTVPAARDAYALLVDDSVDLGFLAVEPAREEGARFTRPYVQIEGVYAVRAGSSLRSAEHVDSDGVTVAVRRGSAYDLYLTARSSTPPSSGATRPRTSSSASGPTCSPASANRSRPTPPHRGCPFSNHHSRRSGRRRRCRARGRLTSQNDCLPWWICSSTTAPSRPSLTAPARR